ncbi:hypothetical protein C5745_13360 [Sphingobacterium haloxyli]|uniref:Glycosyl transferase family 1 domain-containing protein n=2 Tax=Sphingobacterium haloxyli TaxID=2100533 RepID=A0A2S9J2B7_9SPHI|nr:hypothetical protein C5745_13360 [Sphingobacterium haloxyli]
MKIVIVNYRYFVSGGPERYLFNIKQVLESKGHEVIPFSIQHSRNVHSEFSNDFLSSIGTGDEVYFSQYNTRSLKDSVKGFARMTYSVEAKRRFSKFLKKTRPDIVYILYYQNKISCSIVDAAHKLNIPIVHRISDYSLVSPCNSLFRYDKNEICEKCLHGSKVNAVKYKCVYNSAIYSLVKALALKIQDLVDIKSKTDAFIFPSNFTLTKFLEGGFPARKLHYIPTLFNHNILRGDIKISYQNFALYVGRLDQDKGILTMLKAFVNTSYNLKIIGFSSSGYMSTIEDFLKDKNHNIEFLGKMDFKEMQTYLSGCLFTIIPSEWYDNLPNTLLESFAFSKCVIASDLGSLAENIENNITGLLFENKNVNSLKEKVDFLFQNSSEAKRIGKNCGLKIREKYSAEDHYNELMSVFEKVKEDRRVSS